MLKTFVECVWLTIQSAHGFFAKCWITSTVTIGTNKTALWCSGRKLSTCGLAHSPVMQILSGRISSFGSSQPKQRSIEESELQRRG